jgi:hypothetical protein
MKLIKNVSWYKNQYTDYLVIESTHGYLHIRNNPEDYDYYKGLYLAPEFRPINRFYSKQYCSLSKEELVSFQIIILSAYFFQSDLLDDAKVQKKSIEYIDDELELLIQLRSHLRFISEHIDSYEDFLANLNIN